MRSSVLTVPVTFPPEDVPNGEMLSGLPLPDIRGTMGTFYYFATDLSRYEEGNTEFGGILKRLRRRERRRTHRAHRPAESDHQAEDSGDPGERAAADGRRIARRSPSCRRSEDVRIPFTIRWNRAGKTATVEIAGESLLLEPGKMSRWINLDFSVNFLVRVHGMAQLLLDERRTTSCSSTSRR